jgi:hypothetical protein
VLDNADDIDMLFETQRFVDSLLRSSNGTIIITTSNKGVEQKLIDREVTMVEPFSPEDAEQLFRSKLTREDNSDTTTVQILLNEVGFIPLAITQAAAFISENTITVAEYTKKLVKDGSHMREYLGGPRRDPESENSVVRTWKLSFDHIAKERPRAADLLSLMAILDRQAIPKTLLHKDSEDSIGLIEALGTLKAFSLITVEKGGSTFEIHRLVQLSTQKWLALWPHKRIKALELIAENFPRGRYETCEVRDNLFPHVLAALRYGQSSKEMVLQQAKDLEKLAWYDAVCQRYKDAKEIALQRAKLLEKLAWYDKNQGLYDVACQRYMEVFQVREKELGKEDRDTLTSMKNLVLVLRSHPAMLHDLKGLSWLQKPIIEVRILLVLNLPVANK